MRRPHASLRDPHKIDNGPLITQITLSATSAICVAIYRAICGPSYPVILDARAVTETGAARLHPAYLSAWQRKRRRVYRFGKYRYHILPVTVENMETNIIIDFLKDLSVNNALDWMKNNKKYRCVFRRGQVCNIVRRDIQIYETV
jgi:hypothetical protein